MKRLMLLLLVPLFVLALGSQSAAAQAGDSVLSGKAVRWNGDPIVGATIAALTGPLETDTQVASTTTGADGSWSLSVPAGSYWVHIRTFGTWWGYSYQTPFSVTPDEHISQIYFALGPRDVNEITLPTPVSNVAPAIGEDNEEAAATATPVSEVMPAIGVDDEAPAGMPRTGGGADGSLMVLFGVAALILISGIGMRKLERRG